MSETLPIGEPVILPPDVPTDAIGRPLVTADQRDAIRNALNLADPDAKAALLVFADLPNKTARANFAWRIGNNWTVGAGAGFVWEGKQIEGFVGLVKEWK